MRGFRLSDWFSWNERALGGKPVQKDWGGRGGEERGRSFILMFPFHDQMIYGSKDKPKMHYNSFANVQHDVTSFGIDRMVKI